ncbi:MAG: DMT family transporter [Proteobacteria bacterium]|nr:DMT family transporter [Pseudomonadota bacterium]
MIDNSRGILAMSASVLAFIFNDALMKLATETMPAVQAIGLRGLFATLWCAVAVWVSGAWRRVAGISHPSVLARAALEAGAAIVYLIALAHIPFAVATAVNLSTPLFLALLAVLILKETVGWRRWTTIAVGFVGVVMVIQPRPGDVNAWMWAVMVASLLGALRDILGRYVPATVPTVVVSLGSAIGVALAGCVWTSLEGWQPLPIRGLALLAAASILLASGYQLLMLALRSGAEYSVIGSFRYASVLWALGIGYAVWRDVPNTLAVMGIAVIVGSGLYLLHRERVKRISR